ncbi:hypothetical protein ACFFMN_33905 [Planobispora siamensis]|uniref:Uncharacterized protein n=1 Tax=Planobispora siamensis TaxID=936338 RepID=A0A8J3WLL5_9ACTN|nr:MULTISPECIES: hypothetical protein [Planobispora]GIH91951.1 hypothetical protein Psi01_25810 [Planobispora siamensis]
MSRLAVRLAGPAGSAVRALLQALPGLLGLGLVAYGAWLAWPPAGFIAAGALLLADRAWEMTRVDRRDER